MSQSAAQTYPPPTCDNRNSGNGSDQPYDRHLAGGGDRDRRKEKMESLVDLNCAKAQSDRDAEHGGEHTEQEFGWSDGAF